MQVSRNRFLRSILLLSAALALGLLLLYQNRPQDQTVFPAKGPFRVVQVIDGDTIVLDNGETVRLIGVDAPEVHHRSIPAERFGEESKAFLARLAEGQHCTLEYETEAIRDKYGRLLAYVYVGDRLINAELIRLGYATTYTRFPFRRQAEFLALEQEARHHQIGLWKKKTQVISWQEADRHYGEHVTVEGTIVATRNTGKVCFLNFHTDYKRSFTAVIFASALPRFPPAPEHYYLGKKVRVTGLIKAYKGRPEIILEDPAQIEVIQ